jgi:hypothetical protein
MKDSRILIEWLDAKGNKIKFNSAASTDSADDLYKDRFKKLAKHIEDVHGWCLVFYVSEWELDLEYHDGDNAYGLEVDVNSEDIKITINDLNQGDTGKIILSTSVAHGEWSKVLSILKANNVIKDIKLCEWVDAKGNKLTLSPTTATSKQTTKSNGGYREKFIKLLDYHMKHLPPTAVDPEIKTIQDDEFIYEEHHATGDIDYDYDLVVAVAVNKHSDDWDISVYKNGTLVKVDFGNGWEALLKSLRGSLSIPAETTPDYQKLLEWVDSTGNKVSFNNQTNKPATKGESEEVVYIWDMYIDTRDKGTWCSAEEHNGEYDGSVFKTKEAAFREGKIHLYELEDEGELRGLPEDYDIDVIAIPKSKVSDYTLEFSGI